MKRPTLTSQHAVVACALVVLVAGTVSLTRSGTADPTATGIARTGPAPANGEMMTTDARFTTWTQVVLEPGAAITNDPGRAVGYRFVAELDPRTVAKTLAGLVGIGGPVLADDYGNVSVSSDDGSGVFVSNDTVLSFSATAAGRSPWTCVTPASPGAVDGSTGSGGAAPLPVPEPVTILPAPTCTGLGEPPSTDAAITITRDALEALGIDLGDVTFTATRNNVTVTVEGRRSIGGIQLNQGWYAEISAKGLASISGHGAVPVATEPYDIIGARDAVVRSQQTRYSVLGPVAVSDVGAAPAAVARDVAATEPAGPTDVPFVDGVPALTLTAEIRTAERAELGVVEHWSDSGAVLIVPAWIVTDDAGDRWAVVAVADTYLISR